MKEESRKRLTEYIGECWHEREAGYEGNSGHICSKCNEIWYPSKGNRTFQDPADRDAVFEKLVEKEEWVAFEDFAGVAYTNDEGDFIPYTQWLLSRTPEGDYRLCVLVDEYLKMKGV